MVVARPVASFFLYSCILALSACGGSGSSSTSGSGTGSSAPSIPPAVYSGKATGATIDALNAGSVTSFIFSAVEFNEAISSDMIRSFPGGRGTVSGTESGPKGGTVTFQGVIYGFKDGWVTETFKDYTFVPTGATGNLTINGELILEVQGTLATLGYSNYHAQGLGADVSYSGKAVQTAVSQAYINGVPQPVDTTLDLSITDNKTGITDEFVNFEVSTLGGPNDSGNFIDRMFSGRVYSSPLGYFDVSTTGQIEYSGDPSIYLPVGGADVLITSTGADGISVGPLNTYFFSVGLATSPSGQPSTWARFNWSDFTIDETPTTDGVGPVAVAEIDTAPGVGFPITLDARFSHSTNGDFLTFQWTLLHSPPGSKAAITNTTSPLAAITLDAAGDYLVQLRAIDGSHSSVDTIVVSVPRQNAPTQAYPQFVGTAGPDQKASVGETVMLDGRASFPAITGNGNPVFDWTLETPAGSTATLSDPHSPTPTFVPDVPGYYHAVLGSDVLVNSSLTVSVGQTIAFYPAVAFDSSLSPYGTYMFGVADLNADGHPDVIVASPNGMGDQAGVHVYLQSSGGAFRSPDILTDSVGDTFAVGDLNGDGLRDIVTGSEGKVNAYLQAADGRFGTPQSLTFSTASNLPYATPLGVGSLFGSSTMSITAFDGFTTMYEIPVNAAGVMQTPTTTPLSLGAIAVDSISLVDINGDGNADIVASPGVGPLVYTAQSGNTFGAVSLGSAVQAEAGMLYADGKNELVLAGSNSVTIEPENLSGTPVTVSNTLGGVQAIGFGDVGGAGRTDIVLLHDQYISGPTCTCGFGFLYQQPDSSFAQEVLFPIDLDPSGPIWVGDINGDGIPDVMYVIEGQPMIQFGYRP